MGALCASFEEMRRALWENNRVMWRQMEERKRLNAAFAHDLRTPLTVLRGYAGMLLHDLSEGADPAEMAQEVGVMDAQVRRLEDYAQAMSSLQRLEDQPVRRAWVRFDDLRAQMESEMTVLLKDRQAVLDAPREGGSGAGCGAGDAGIRQSFIQCSAFRPEPGGGVARLEREHAGPLRQGRRPRLYAGRAPARRRALLPR